MNKANKTRTQKRGPNQPGVMVSFAIGLSNGLYQVGRFNPTPPSLPHK